MKFVHKKRPFKTDYYEKLNCHSLYVKEARKDSKGEAPIYLRITINGERAEIMTMTDYLIIIGYSFPTFNRKVDRELLKSLKATVKFFIQSPSNDIGSVVHRFGALTINKNEINRITQTDEFFIPFEYQ